MPTTCLLCYEEAQHFLMPPCNHKQMCWRCCLKLIEGSTFSCPFCKDIQQGKSCILFVSEQEMHQYTFEQIFKKNVLRSSAKTYQFYSNEEVGKFIEEQTSFFCRLCFQIFPNINFLKKHLNTTHNRQFCDVCVENRKCLISQQILFTQGELIAHQKKGQFSEDGELVLYHPFCEFCKIRFYDIDALKAHLRISSHLKCHICDKNYSHLKYVYYKDIDEIEKHFKKSHFMCTEGACIQMRLQNVFVSQEALQDHKNRVHIHKYRGKQSQSMNLLLFRTPQEEQAIQWDKIGKDFMAEFKKSEKHYELSNQEHSDGPIDIRQFYPEKVKTGNRLPMKIIVDKLQEHLFIPDPKKDEIALASIPFFTPMTPDCPSIFRHQVQKTIKKVFDPRMSEQIITTFFQKKHQFKNMKEYFVDIRRTMSKFNKIAYYYIFPLLIRFLRNENPAKSLMDNFYSDSLRDLKINKEFIFHKLENYSDIFILLQEHIEGYIYEQLYEENIDLAVYKQYLREMNSNFYTENYEKMFYVPKDKVVNLYHMVEKCKTRELPKFNWLLKVGFSTQSLKIVMKEFYYKTIDSCKDYLKALSLRQIALLYSYSGISIEALVDKNRFRLGKQHPMPLFLSQILSRIPGVIQSKQKIFIETLERKSLQIHNTRIDSKNKGIIINEGDHPSLLQFDTKAEKQQQFPTLSIPSSVTVSKNKQTRRLKQKKQEKMSEEYPSLMSQPPKAMQEKEQEDFPVLIYNEKSIEIKNRQKYNKITERESNMKKRMKMEEEDQEDNKIKKFGLFSKHYKSGFKEDYSQRCEGDGDRGWNDEMPTLPEVNKQTSVENSSKKKKKEKNKKVEEIVQQKGLDETNDFQLSGEIIMGKKNLKQDQSDEDTKKNKKNKKKNKSIKNDANKSVFVKKQQKKINISSDDDDFPALDGTKVEISEPIKTKKNKVRLDMSDSDDERRKVEQKRKQFQEEKKKIRQEEQNKRAMLRPEGFECLKSEDGQESIINQIIKSSVVEEKAPEIKVKKGKKGKTVVIEKFDIFKR